MKKNRMRSAASAIMAAALIAASSSARAAEVGPCGDLDKVSFLVGQTKSYAEGKIRVAHVDTDGEPVCCSSHLLIFIPSREGGSQCFALSQRAQHGDTGPLGFSDVGFAQITAAYDAGRGLLLTVPFTLYNPEQKKGNQGMARLRVNLSDEGMVAIEQEL